MAFESVASRAGPPPRRAASHVAALGQDWRSPCIPAPRPPTSQPSSSIPSAPLNAARSTALTWSSPQPRFPRASHLAATAATPGATLVAPTCPARGTSTLTSPHWTWREPWGLLASTPGCRPHPTATTATTAAANRAAATRAHASRRAAPADGAAPSDPTPPLAKRTRKKTRPTDPGGAAAGAAGERSAAAGHGPASQAVTQAPATDVSTEGAGLGAPAAAKKTRRRAAVSAKRSGGGDAGSSAAGGDAGDAPDVGAEGADLGAPAAAKKTRRRTAVSGGGSSGGDTAAVAAEEPPSGVVPPKPRRPRAKVGASREVPDVAGASEPPAATPATAAAAKAPSPRSPRRAAPSAAADISVGAQSTREVAAARQAASSLSSASPSGAATSPAPTRQPAPPSPVAPPSPARPLPTRHIVAAVDPDMGGAIALVYWDEEPPAPGAGAAAAAAAAGAEGGGAAGAAGGGGAAGERAAGGGGAFGGAWLQPAGEEAQAAGAGAAAVGSGSEAEGEEEGEGEEGGLLGADPLARVAPPPPGALSRCAVRVWDMPVAAAELRSTTPLGRAKRRRMLHVAGAAAVLSHALALALPPPTHRVALYGYVEVPPILPGDGNIATYVTLYSTGAWLGLLSGMGFKAGSTPVARWKRDLGIYGAASKGADLALARHIWPREQRILSAKKHHGRADALLIAAWALGAHCHPALTATLRRTRTTLDRFLEQHPHVDGVAWGPPRPPAPSDAYGNVLSPELDLMQELEATQSKVDRADQRRASKREAEEAAREAREEEAARRAAERAAKKEATERAKAERAAKKEEAAGKKTGKAVGKKAGKAAQGAESSSSSGERKRAKAKAGAVRAAKKEVGEEAGSEEAEGADAAAGGEAAAQGTLDGGGGGGRASLAPRGRKAG